jgi:hypothetical protein
MLVDLVFNEIEGSDFDECPDNTWRVGSDVKTMPRVGRNRLACSTESGDFLTMTESRTVRGGGLTGRASAAATSSFEAILRSFDLKRPSAACGC